MRKLFFKEEYFVVLLITFFLVRKQEKHSDDFLMTEEQITAINFEEEFPIDKNYVLSYIGSQYVEFDDYAGFTYNEVDFLDYRNFEICIFAELTSMLESNIFDKEIEVAIEHHYDSTEGMYCYDKEGKSKKLINQIGASYYAICALRNIDACSSHEEEVSGKLREFFSSVTRNWEDEIKLYMPFR